MYLLHFHEGRHYVRYYSFFIHLAPFRLCFAICYGLHPQLLTPAYAYLIMVIASSQEMMPGKFTK